MKPEPGTGPRPRVEEEKIDPSSSQRFERRDGRGLGRNGHHDRERDRRMDSRGGFGRGMPPMMHSMGYGHEPMYGRGPPMRGGGQMFPPGPPGYGRMDPWMGGMHAPNMYPPMMGMPMNPMVASLLLPPPPSSAL
jgi:hypothetical protein